MSQVFFFPLPMQKEEAKYQLKSIRLAEAIAQMEKMSRIHQKHMRELLTLLYEYDVRYGVPTVVHQKSPDWRVTLPTDED